MIVRLKVLLTTLANDAYQATTAVTRPSQPPILPMLSAPPPHLIMRFHTSPDGRAARRTAAITVCLLSVFYLVPGIYGVLGKVLVPQLYLTGATDTAVVALSSQVDTGVVGTTFTALLTAGAFAAFLWTPRSW